MAEIKIKQAGAEHTILLLMLARYTFYETFAKDNSEANMQKYLAENFTGPKIESEISNPDSLFFIAWLGEKPVGYLKLNSGKAQTELQDENSLEIERIYLISEFHGHKVGQPLYNKAVEIAMHKSKAFIWLGVWEENQRAIKFYEKNGFTAFDKHIFRMGDDEQTDILMKMVLVA